MSAKKVAFEDAARLLVRARAALARGHVAPSVSQSREALPAPFAGEFRRAGAEKLDLVHM